MPPSNFTTTFEVSLQTAIRWTENSLTAVFLIVLLFFVDDETSWKNKWSAFLPTVCKIEAVFQNVSFGFFLFAIISATAVDVAAPDNESTLLVVVRWEEERDNNGPPVEFSFFVDEVEVVAAVKAVEYFEARRERTLSMSAGPKLSNPGISQEQQERLKEIKKELQLLKNKK